MSPEILTRPRRADVDAVYRESSDWAKAAGPATDLVAAVRKMVDRLADRGLDLTGLRQVPTVAAGVPVEWLVPLSAASDVRIVYLHGGGWVSGNIATSRARGAELARLSGASVLLVDYRLAPENSFPAGLEDSLQTLQLAFANGPDGPDRPDAARPTVCLLGESAGAGLAASVCAEACARA